MSHLEQSIPYALDRFDGLSAYELVEMLDEPLGEVLAALGRLVQAGRVERDATSRSKGGTWHLRGIG